MERVFAEDFEDDSNPTPKKQKTEEQPSADW